MLRSASFPVFLIATLFPLTVRAESPILALALDSATTCFEFEKLLDETPKPIRGELKIPRLAVDEQTQQRLSLQMQRDGKTALGLAFAYRFTGEERYKEKCLEFLLAWSEITSFEDGGRFFWDFFILRMAGDTPIVTFCQFGKFLLASDLSGERPGAFIAQVSRAYSYAQVYSPAQNNNHRSWKNLFLLACSLYLEDGNEQEYFQELSDCISSQIEDDGRMTLELERGKKALSYTLMNLEALVLANQIARTHGVRFDEDRLKRAVDLYALFFEDEEKWRKFTGIDEELNTPNPLEDWSWIFVLPRKWWTDRDYPWGQNLDWGMDARRAYWMFFPQVVKP